MQWPLNDSQRYAWLPEPGTAAEWTKGGLRPVFGHSQNTATLITKTPGRLSISRGKDRRSLLSRVKALGVPGAHAVKLFVVGGLPFASIGADISGQCTRYCVVFRTASAGKKTSCQLSAVRSHHVLHAGCCEEASG